MKPLRTRLEEARHRLGLPWEVLERDYLLSWVLAGLAQVESLRDTLVFKGGTALKKCYFGDYRFSEDLDFSALEGVPTGDALERAIRVLEAYRGQMDLADFSALLGKKCAVRHVTFAGPEDFFPRTMLDSIEKTWAQWLGPLVPRLPSFNALIGELHPQIASLVSAPG